jgi:hypothetical protein
MRTASWLTAAVAAALTAVPAGAQRSTAGSISAGAGSVSPGMVGRVRFAPRSDGRTPTLWVPTPVRPAPPMVDGGGILGRRGTLAVPIGDITTIPGRDPRLGPVPQNGGASSSLRSGLPVIRRGGHEWAWIPGHGWVIADPGTTPPVTDPTAGPMPLTPLRLGSNAVFGIIGPRLPFGRTRVPTLGINVPVRPLGRRFR